MNLSQAIDALVHRKDRTGAGYTQGEVAAWAEAFEDLPLADVLAAINGIATAGQKQITVPAVVNWLAIERRRRADLESARPTRYDCECTASTLCDMHRQVGLDAIRKIRETHWNKVARTRLEESA